MEAVYKRQDGKKVLLFDDGNQIVVSLIGSARNIQWGIVCRDYQSGATSLQFQDEIYVAYLNLENHLCFENVLNPGGVTVALGEKIDEVSDVRLVHILGENSGLYVTYRKKNFATGENSICIVNPLGERNMQILITEKERIESYSFFDFNHVTYLIYRLTTVPQSQILAIDINYLGDISLYKKILCKEQTIEELKKRCKENDREFQKAVKEKEREYERRLMETTKNMEKRYKEQYDDLAKLCKGMKEEGIKWRDKYYKTVTKN